MRRRVPNVCTGQCSENVSFLLPLFVLGCTPSLEASPLISVLKASGKQTTSIYTAEKPRILYNM